jgi:hypothetical protein
VRHHHLYREWLNGIDGMSGFYSVAISFAAPFLPRQSRTPGGNLLDFSDFLGHGVDRYAVTNNYIVSYLSFVSTHILSPSTLITMDAVPGRPVWPSFYGRPDHHRSVSNLVIVIVTDIAFGFHSTVSTIHSYSGHSVNPSSIPFHDQR